MISKRFRVIAVVASLIMITVVIVGCGGGADEEPAPMVEQPAAQPAQQPAQQPARQPVQQPAEQEAVAEKPAVVREAAESPYGFYTIQLSSWRTEAKADREARRYQEMGLEAYTQKADIPGMGTWYRVRVGRYQALAEAQETARSLVNIENNWVDNFTRGDVPPDI